MLQPVLRAAFRPWFDECEWNAPSPQLVLIMEWARVVSSTLGGSREPDNTGLRVRSVDFSGAGELHLNVTGVPDGGREHGVFQYHADRRDVVEAAVRTIAARSWRWNALMDNVEPQAPDWREFFCNIYEPLMACGCETGDGWSDLLHAMALHLSGLISPSEADPRRIIQIKEKFGGLRVYHQFSANFRISGVIAAYEVLSYAICETCGRPGSLRNYNGYLHTACSDHTRGGASEGSG